MAKFDIRLLGRIARYTWDLFCAREISRESCGLGGKGGTEELSLNIMKELKEVELGNFSEFQSFSTDPAPLLLMTDRPSRP
jgi:hypothetical protein